MTEPIISDVMHKPEHLVMTIILSPSPSPSTLLTFNDLFFFIANSYSVIRNASNHGYE